MREIILLLRSGARRIGHFFLSKAWEWQVKRKFSKTQGHRSMLRRNTIYLVVTRWSTLNRYHCITILIKLNILMQKMATIVNPKNDNKTHPEDAVFLHPEVLIY